MKKRFFLLTIAVVLASCDFSSSSINLFQKNDNDIKLFFNVASYDYEYYLSNKTKTIFNKIQEAFPLYSNKIITFAQLYYASFALEYAYGVSSSESSDDVRVEEYFIKNMNTNYLMSKVDVFEIDLTKEPFNKGLFYGIGSYNEYLKFDGQKEYLYNYEIFELKDKQFFQASPYYGYFCEYKHIKDDDYYLGYRTSIKCPETAYDEYSEYRFFEMIHSENLLPTSWMSEYYNFNQLSLKNYITYLESESFQLTEFIQSAIFDRINKESLNAIRALTRYFYYKPKLFPEMAHINGVSFEENIMHFYNNGGGSYCLPNKSNCQEIVSWNYPNLSINFSSKTYNYNGDEPISFANKPIQLTDLEKSNLLSSEKFEDFQNLLDNIQFNKDLTDLELFLAILNL